jgi:hypothetical protein
MPVDHLFHRATEIYVDNSRAAIGVELCRLAHHARLAASQLHRHWLLVGVAFGHLHRLTGLADHRFTGDHLGNDEPGAKSLYEPAERQIADPRHGREDDRIIEGYSADRDAHRIRNFTVCLPIGQNVTCFHFAAQYQ